MADLVVIVILVVVTGIVIRVMRGDRKKTGRSCCSGGCGSCRSGCKVL